jgi:hypothetical protein
LCTVNVLTGVVVNASIDVTDATLVA